LGKNVVINRSELKSALYGVFKNRTYNKSIEFYTTEKRATIFFEEVPYRAKTGFCKVKGKLALRQRFHIHLGTLYKALKNATKDAIITVDLKNSTLLFSYTIRNTPVKFSLPIRICNPSKSELAIHVGPQKQKIHDQPIETELPLTHRTYQSQTWGFRGAVLK
jgi:hypothetical protein